MSQKIRSMAYGPKRKMPISLTRIQILTTRLLEGYVWVEGRPTKIQESTRPDSICPKAWTPLSKEQGENKLQSGQISAKLQSARRKSRLYEVSAGDGGCLR